MEKGYSRRAWTKFREETIEKGDYTEKGEIYTRRWNIHGDEANTERRLLREGIHGEGTT